jgi:hypothetical protein
MLRAVEERPRAARFSERRPGRMFRGSAYGIAMHLTYCVQGYPSLIK